MKTVFPARHLSPAGALCVAKALEKARPDIVMLEIPCDMTPCLGYLTMPDTRPPAAICAYDRSDPSRSVFFPAGETSPELAALRWCAANGVPARGMDLPARRFFSGRAVVPPGASAAYERMAALAGEECFDDFWERVFENPEHNTGAVMAFGAALRELAPPDSFFAEREEHMRGEIAFAEKEGSVFALCGAYHAPALLSASSAPAVRGRDDPRLGFCVIPYTHGRLCHGYGGGNGSPRYHELIMKNGGDRLRAAGELLTEIIRLLRENGIPAGAADAMDCLALARSLASLRSGSAIPVLSELRAAAGACVPCAAGELDRAFSVCAEGEAVGSVPPSPGRTPLMEDFHTRIRFLGLEGTEKITVFAGRGRAGGRDGEKSMFLHSLLLMKIPFVKKERSSFDRGEDREDWEMRRGPETESALLALSSHGATVRDAASGLLRSSCGRSLPALSDALEWCVRCGFFELLGELLPEFDGLSAKESDLSASVAALRIIDRLCAAVLPEAAREALFALRERLFLRCCLIAGEDIASPETVLRALSAISRRFPENGAAVVFSQTLKRLAASGKPPVSGCACALLAQYGSWDARRLSREIARRLRPDLTDGFPGWTRGYLSVCGGSAREALFEGLDEIIKALPEDEFIETLPVFRRAFGGLSEREREDAALRLMRPGVPPGAGLSKSEMDALAGFDFSY